MHKIQQKKLLQDYLKHPDETRDETEDKRNENIQKDEERREHRNYLKFKTVHCTSHGEHCSHIPQSKSQLSQNSKLRIHVKQVLVLTK